MDFIELDGATGEGGGQILRTALTLSMITGQPFRMINIRANRPKPGLMRQHLVAVQAAASVCNAQIGDTRAGAMTLEFVPGKITGGTYQFAIGTAGSCTLVLQTLLPALLYADCASTVKISGGTHNSMAPPAQFLQRSYARVLADMGATLDLQLKRYGFYPAGGGEMLAHITPCAQLRPLHLQERGERIAGYAESMIAGVPLGVAQRELECVGKAMGWNDAQEGHAQDGRLRVVGLSNDQGQEQGIARALEHQHVTAVFCAFGEKSVRAEAVAKKLIAQVRAYTASNAAVDEHLADQIMLPFALAGSGSFSTSHISQHAHTNAGVIERFLPVRVTFTEEERRAVCTVTLR